MNLKLDKPQLDSFCQKHHILRLALFGSAIRDDFGPESDIDVLVEFEDGFVPGLRFFGMQDELSALLGRKVDLSTPGFLNPEFRNQVLEESRTLYVAA